MMLSSPRGKEFTDLGTQERKSSDELLLHLARTMIADKRPRRTTGEIWIWKEGNVATVRKNEPISRTLNKLATENFLSCPVLDETGSYVGVVDMLDFCIYLTSLFAGESSAAWTDFFAKRQEWDDKCVSDIMKTKSWTHRRGSHDVYATLQDGFSLLHAFEVLARTKCHRIPVVNDANNIVGIYTNSYVNACMLYLYMHNNNNKMIRTHKCMYIQDGHFPHQAEPVHVQHACGCERWRVDPDEEL